MIVSELSKESGVNSNTIRYYCKIGLLDPQRDLDNGYKIFRLEDAHKLKFIQQAKELGFTLNHIKGLLKRVKKGESVCDLAKLQIEENIRKCDEDIAQLKTNRKRMEVALLRWQGLPSELPTEYVWCHLIERYKT